MEFALNLMHSESSPSRGNKPRRHERIPFTGRVTLGEGRGDDFAALDLSAGGVGLLSAQEVPVGKLLRLTFLRGSIVVNGFVCHADALKPDVWRLGVAFLQDEHELASVAFVAQ